MLIYSILFLLSSNAVFLKRDKFIIFTAIILFAILYSGYIIFTSNLFFIIEWKGLGYLKGFFPISVNQIMHLYFLALAKTIKPIVKIVVLLLAIIIKEDLEKQSIKISLFFIFLSLHMFIVVVFTLFRYFFISAAVFICPTFGLYFFKQFAYINYFNPHYFLLGLRLETEKQWLLEKRALDGNNSIPVTLGHLGWNYTI